MADSNTHWIILFEAAGWLRKEEGDEEQRARTD